MSSSTDVAVKHEAGPTEKPALSRYRVTCYVTTRVYVTVDVCAEGTEHEREEEARRKAAEALSQKDKVPGNSTVVSEEAYSKVLADYTVKVGS